MESKKSQPEKKRSRGRASSGQHNFADWARKAAGTETYGEKKQRGSAGSSFRQERTEKTPRKRPRPDSSSTEGTSTVRNRDDRGEKRRNQSDDRLERREEGARNARGRVKGGPKAFIGKKPSRPVEKKGFSSKRGKSGYGEVSQKEYLRDEIRLNKFIAHAGLCSRREADQLIEAGEVTVNGEVVTTLGTKVRSRDKVVVNKQKLSLEPFVYILLNKGRDTISTTDDEKERNTVLDAIEGATGQRVYPVGRLDRNTMGLLILTNDGDLAHRLMHPSYKVKKTYEVTSGRVLTDDELSQLRAGITLEDGPVKPAGVKRASDDPYTISLSVFEGRNHLIRRMISHLGAEVVKLTRIRYAGLRIEDLRVGRWRYLKQKEINDLRRLVKLDLLEFNTDKK